MHVIGVQYRLASESVRAGSSTRCRACGPQLGPHPVSRKSRRANLDDAAINASVNNATRALRCMLADEDTSSSDRPVLGRRAALVSMSSAIFASIVWSANAHRWRAWSTG